MLPAHRERCVTEGGGFPTGFADSSLRRLSVSMTFPFFFLRWCRPGRPFGDSKRLSHPCAVAQLPHGLDLHSPLPAHTHKPPSFSPCVLIGKRWGGGGFGPHSALPAPTPPGRALQSTSPPQSGSSPNKQRAFLYHAEDLFENIFGEPLSI